MNNLLKIIQLKIQIIALKIKKLFFKKEEHKSRLRDWALAIQEYEGWYPGSLTYRQNNPGALRWSKYEIDNKNGFSVFSDYETGLKALEFQLQIAADGRSKVYNPEMTLKDFFKVYAPSSDNNDPERYANFVIAKLEVLPFTKIRNLI